MSEQAGKQISAVERASEASRLEQVDEWGERMSEWMSKWPGTYISILDCSDHQHIVIVIVPRSSHCDVIVVKRRRSGILAFW